MTAIFLSAAVVLISATSGICLAEDQKTLRLQNATPDTFDNTSEIRDIYGPIVLPEPFNWLPYLTALLAILFFCIFFIFYLKKRKPSVAASVPPHETALAELVHARRYIENNHSLQYAQRISEILRTYIERRFQIRVTRQTTVEFLMEAQRDQDGQLYGYRESLKKCLELCDLAKYARKAATRANMEDMEESVRFFIKDTVEAKEE